MNNNIQKVQVTEEQFFKFWLNMLQPFIKLRQQEVDLLSKLLYHRYVISESTSDKTMVDFYLFSPENRKKMRAELDFEIYTFNNNLAILRKKRLVIGKALNLLIVPSIEKPFKSFRFTYVVEIGKALNSKINEE
jgi:hypothetical protein